MSQFDPEAWFVLPDGSAIPRSPMNPCPRGNPIFEIRSHVYRNKQEGTSSRADVAVCPRCVKLDQDDRKLGVLDVNRERRPG